MAKSTTRARRAGVRRLEHEGWLRDVVEGMHSTSFARTWGVVDATHDEVHNLWWMWSEHYRVPWTQETMGSLLTIGYIDERPIAVSTEWVLIDGVRIAFICGTSQLVDYEMIERWRSVVFGPHRHSDVANFGHIIAAIEEANGHQIVDPSRMNAVDAVLQCDHIDDDALLVADTKLEPHQSFTWCERKMQLWGERARHYQNLMRQEGPHAEAKETTTRR